MMVMKNTISDSNAEVAMPSSQGIIAQQVINQKPNNNIYLTTKIMNTPIATSANYYVQQEAIPATVTIPVTPVENTIVENHTPEITVEQNSVRENAIEETHTPENNKYEETSLIERENEARENSPFEIFNLETMKSVLKRGYSAHQQISPEHILGLLAFYTTPTVKSLDEIKKQLETPDKASMKEWGWHAMHYCLACLAGEDLDQYVQLAVNTYTHEDWVELNVPARGSVGLLHALAMNSDKDAALRAFHTLNAIERMPWSTCQGFLGLLPTHLAVINKSYELANALQDLCAGEDGKERLTSFPLTSEVLKANLNRGSLFNLSSMRCRKTTANASCNSDMLRETYITLRKQEVYSLEHLKAAFAQQTFRKETSLRKVTEGYRMQSKWLCGLAIPMEVNMLTLSKMHCMVIDQYCTSEQLNNNAELYKQLWSEKDSHGRTPLFYALACGSEQVIRWCLANCPETARLGVDSHHRSLLTALAMNPCAHQVLDLVEEIISEETLQEDIFGLSPVIYAMVCKNSALAKKMIETTQDLCLEGLADRKAKYQKYKRVATVLRDEDMLQYLKDHTPSANNTWGAYGCYF